MVQSEACIVMVLAGCRNFFSNLQNYCVNDFTRNWTSKTCSQTLLYKVQTWCLFRPWGVAKPIQAKKSTNEINSFGKIITFDELRFDDLLCEFRSFDKPSESRISSVSLSGAALFRNWV